MPNQLKNMTIKSVHLVGSPAIRKKYLIVKSEEGNMTEEEKKAQADAEAAKAKVEADAAAIAKAEEATKAAEDAKKVAEEALNAKDAALIKSALEILKSSSSETAKSAAEELEATIAGKKVEKSTKTTDSEVAEILKSQLPAFTKSLTEPITKALEDARKEMEEIKKSNAELVSEKVERDIAEITNKLVGDKTENAEYIRSMKAELSPEGFTKFVNREVKKAEEIRKSSAFKEIGSTKAATQSDSAWEELKKLADEKVTKSESKMSFTNALSAVFLEKPELYDQYRNGSYVSQREDN